MTTSFCSSKRPRWLFQNGLMWYSGPAIKCVCPGVQPQIAPPAARPGIAAPGAGVRMIFGRPVEPPEPIATAGLGVRSGSGAAE